MTASLLASTHLSQNQRLHRARAAFTAGLVGFAVDLPADESLSATRGSPALSSARQLVMHLLHAGFSMSLAQIAGALRRDRSTIAYGVHRVEDRREAPGFDRWVDSLEELLRLVPEPVLRDGAPEPQAQDGVDGDCR